MAREIVPLPISADIVRTDGFGGTQQWLWDYESETSDMFNHVTIGTKTALPRAREAYEAISTLIIPEHQYPDDGIDAPAKEIEGIIADNRIDVILTCQHPTDVIGKRASEALGIPTVMYELLVPDTSSPLAVAEMEEIVAASYDGAFNRIIYTAESSRREHEAYGVNPRGAMVIPAGINLTRFQRDEVKRRQVRSKLGLSDADTLIGVVAQDRPEKDPQAMLEIATRLIYKCIREDRPVPHFAVMGMGFEPDRQKWVDALEKRNVSRYVHLLGLQSDMPGVYSAMDMNFLPSRAEGSALTAFEGMACGVPFIGTKVGDHELNLGSTAVLLDSRGGIPLDKWSGVDAFVHALLAMEERLSNPDARLATERIIVDRARQFDARKFARQLGEVVLTEWRRGKAPPW